MRDDILYVYIYTLYTFFRESVDMCYSNNTQDVIDDYFRNINQLCLDKYNKLIFKSICGFPDHAKYINNELKKKDMDKYQKDRFAKLSSSNDVFNYDVNNLKHDLVQAYNNTWCRNNVFSIIEVNKRLEFCPLVLPHPDPGPRRP